MLGGAVKKGKCLSIAENRTLTVQPLARRYTEWGIPKAELHEVPQKLIGV
jgi:hypothetical protein